MSRQIVGVIMLVIGLISALILTGVFFCGWETVLRSLVVLGVVAFIFGWYIVALLLIFSEKD